MHLAATEADISLRSWFAKMFAMSPLATLYVDAVLPSSGKKIYKCRLNKINLTVKNAAFKFFTSCKSTVQTGPVLYCTTLHQPLGIPFRSIATSMKYAGE